MCAYGLSVNRRTIEQESTVLRQRRGSGIITVTIHVAGKQASVSIGSDVFIADGESLELRSTGDASKGTGAAIVSGGTVSVEAGAVFSVSNQATEYRYDISDLQNKLSYALEDAALLQMQTEAVAEISAHQEVGDGAGNYVGQFDAAIAANLQAAGAVDAKGGLILTGGSTYKTEKAHTNLNGGTLTLDTMEHSLLTFSTTPDIEFDASSGETQLVLFSGVSSVYFGYDKLSANEESTVYYTRADRYITGCDYIDERTLLVYDAQADVVYLQMVVPEPTTATLSLLALAALAARRKRK